MSQIFEALRRAETVESRSRRRNIVLMDDTERRRSERRTIPANIRIYGHGQGSCPFFEENPVLDASALGALMLMKTPVVAGQKLLLINEAAAQVQECRVVRTYCRNSQELEVAIEFPSPQPGFWNRLELEEESETTGADKRKLPRIALPRGMSVIWKGQGEPVVSRVQDLSAGGLSIVTPEAPATGELLQVSFLVPAGVVNARSVVRHSRSGEGMGIEFVAMSDEARVRLDHLLQKLLG